MTSTEMRVAVEYDLMIQPKPPAASMRHEEAMRFLSQRSGKQFDPEIIEIISQLSHDDPPHDSLVAVESLGQFDQDIDSARVDAMLS